MNKPIPQTEAHYSDADEADHEEDMALALARLADDGNPIFPKHDEDEKPSDLQN